MQNKNSNQPGSKNYSVVSAEHYQAFRRQLELQQNLIKPSADPLQPTDRIGRSVEAMCASLTVSILEALIGRRPVTQLERWFSKTCFQKVQRRASITRNAIACQYANPAIQYAPYTKIIKLPKVKKVRAQNVGEGKYEVCVLVTDGQRTRALALRVERVHNNWHITDLEIA